MRTPTHQTVRLSRGRHAGPEQGACVMELASMLAGEPFTDHPAAVSPVIGAFLRSYNDRVGGEPRQALYRYAAMVVGTRTTDDVEAARAEACATWLERMIARRGRFSWRRWRAALCGRHVDGQTPTGIARTTGEFAARLVRQEGERGESSVLELLDRLIAMPGPRREAVAATRRPLLSSPPDAAAVAARRGDPALGRSARSGTTAT